MQYKGGVFLFPKAYCYTTYFIQLGIARVIYDTKYIKWVHNLVKWACILLIKNDIPGFIDAMQYVQQHAVAETASVLLKPSVEANFGMI